MPSRPDTSSDIMSSREKDNYIYNDADFIERGTLILEHNAETLEGVVQARFNDIRVIITQPFAGISQCSHIPVFALPYDKFVRHGELTECGWSTARRLLTEIYENCCFCEANWDTVVQACLPVWNRGKWAIVRENLKNAAVDGVADWCLGLILLPLVALFTDWDMRQECQFVISGRFGRRFPDDLAQRVVDRLRWNHRYQAWKRFVNFIGLSSRR